MIPDRQSVGRLGESIAADYLCRKGYEILAKNIRIAGCEVDILGKRGKIVSLIEVKSISREMSHGNEGTLEVHQLASRSGVQEGAEVVSPEDHIDRKKLARLKMAGDAYAPTLEEGLDIQIDVVAVRLDFTVRRAVCTLYEKV